MNALELKNVKKAYPDFQLGEISLVLPAGYIMGLVGENGAGKTTVIKLILDMVRPDGGEITVLGESGRSSFCQIKEEIGVVLDQAYFPESITAREVNSMMKHTYRNWDEKAYFDYIRHFSLPDRKRFREFSRGMKMKLAISVALSHHPKLLILDEPTSGLDPVARDEIVELFYEFTRDESHSILISSHIVSDLEKLCDYVAFLHKGKLLLNEEKDRLLEDYGILHCDKSQLALLPDDAVIGLRDTGYGIEALAVRKKIPSGFSIDPPSLEDIIVFMATRS